ncbi:MAG: hypothetical protein M3020_10300 [Myxococcota bacterium]|nr:hypothetical protein [Myxococcota bacterium]
MKTLVSFPALTLALAASLGMQGCGGDTKSNEDDEGAGSGGKTNTGGAATGGKTVTGGTASGGVSATGGTSAVARPCEDPQPVLDPEGNPTGYETCANGGGHRVSAEECAIRLPREDDACPAEDAEHRTCQTDADCSDGLYGTCAPQPQTLTCGCSYGCKTDADCAGGGVCLCFGVAGTCSPATCRTDADCEDGFECRAFQDPTTNLCDVTRFECQTAEDTCQHNADCDRSASEMCVSDATGAHRCRQMPCATPGRPFWIDGEVRTASASSSGAGDWAGEVIAALDSELSASDRLALRDYFSRAALLEHASVAAFARFLLELMHFGAPLELVLGAQRAMGEELQHAQACFALASRYGGERVGPGALDVGGCLEHLTLADAVRAAVREGCVGETVAAVQAAEAFEHARDPEVRAALQRIRRDEWEHAQLSFRFVRWALEVDPTLSAAVLDELRGSLPEVQGGAELSHAQRRRAEHGLLPEAHLTTIAARVHREIVSPLLSELVARACERAAA